MNITFDDLIKINRYQKILGKNNYYDYCSSGFVKIKNLNKPYDNKRNYKKMCNYIHRKIIEVLSIYSTTKIISRDEHVRIKDNIMPYIENMNLLTSDIFDNMCDIEKSIIFFRYCLNKSKVRLDYAGRSLANWDNFVSSCKGIIM